MKKMHKMSCAIDCIVDFFNKIFAMKKKRLTFANLKIHNHNTIP